MNKRQKEVKQFLLDEEKATLNELKKSYKDALDDINSKLGDLMARQDADLQHVIYQIEYQKSLKTQVQGILEQLHSNEFEIVSKYLTNSYTHGFVGTMYDLAGQGIPLIMPIEQNKVLDAILNETKLKEKLYESLGHDIKELRKTISAEISRGISTGLSYTDIARNLKSSANIPMNRAMTIARTEAHRINCKATSDAQYVAKSKGADVLKQWDASLDGVTRPTHKQLDGQIRELDEPFSVGTKKAKYPGAFGDPAEDCNCRCAILQRARWALDEEELEVLKERAAEHGLDKTEDFADYEKKFLKVSESDRVRSNVQMMNDEDTKNVYQAIKDAVIKVIDKANEHKPIKFVDLKSKYKVDIQDVFDNAPDNIKRINRKYADSIRFVNEKQLGKAHTSYKGISVNFKVDSKNERGSWTTTFHEIGHAIDRAAGNVSIKSTSFGKLLKSDFNEVVKNYQKVYNVNIDEAYESIGNVLYTNPKYHSISDIAGGLTKNKCKGRYSHKTEYWKPNKVEKEAFAHFYEATARNDDAKLSVLKSMFPNAYNEFERIVASI